MTDEHTKQQVLLCTVCDATHPSVIAEHGTDAKERDCVAEWLTGMQLTTERATCFCWEDDPFPIANFPQVSNGERRFHHYFTIAKILKVSGKNNRAKLPLCVTKRIAKNFPDAEGAPAKVGYKQEPSE